MAGKGNMEWARNTAGVQKISLWVGSSMNQIMNIITCRDLLSIYHGVDRGNHWQETLLELREFLLKRYLQRTTLQGNTAGAERIRFETGFTRWTFWSWEELGANFGLTLARNTGGLWIETLLELREFVLQTVFTEHYSAWKHCWSWEELRVSKS